MQTRRPSDSAGDLRYELQVLYDYSHLGLDDEHVSNLRDFLEGEVRQMEETEEADSSETVRRATSPGI
jgi:hypothetical protein